MSVVYCSRTLTGRKPMVSLLFVLFCNLSETEIKCVHTDISDGTSSSSAFWFFSRGVGWVEDHVLV